ncbi:MAG: hypothetical protein ACRC5A_08890, partial [Enterobacteriaceae bacterium]
MISGKNSDTGAPFAQTFTSIDEMMPLMLSHLNPEKAFENLYTEKQERSKARADIAKEERLYGRQMGLEGVKQGYGAQRDETRFMNQMTLDMMRSAQKPKKEDDLLKL